MPWTNLSPLVALVEGFRPRFRHEAFHTFQHVLVGWIVCPGPHPTSEVWQAAGRAATHHHDTAYSLFSSAAWGGTNSARSWSYSSSPG